MSNDDRFRPSGNRQPDPSGDGAQNTPDHPQGGQPSSFPDHPQNQHGNWSAQPPHPGQGQYGVPSPQSGQGPYGNQSPQTGQVPYGAPGPYSQGQAPHTGQGPYGGPGQTPHTGQGPYGNTGQSPQTGQFGQHPTGQYPPQVQPGGYPGGPGGPGGYPPVVQQRPGRRRSTAVIAILLVIVLILVGLGVWWWVGRSDAVESADGAESPTEAADLFVERFNGDDFTDIYQSISPAEQQYASAMTALLMRYSWNATGVELDEEEAQEEVLEALSRYSEVVDFDIAFNQYDEVELTDTMSAVVVTDGTISFAITDIDEFAEITGDVIEEVYTEEQIRENFGYSSIDELKRILASELRSSDETELEAEFTDSAPMILVMVEEEKGWYISPITSGVAYMNVDFFTDDSVRNTFVQRNGDFTLSAPERAETPEAAAENFIDALANEPISELLGYLPLAEQRGLGLLLYLLDEPGVEQFSIGDLILLSNLRTTTIEVSDHSALTLLESLRLDVNPAFSGQAMQIVLEDGQMTIGTCAPVDISLLMDEDAPLLAFAVVEDESGWNVSLIGTALNAVIAATTAEENLEEYSDLADELSRCLG